MKEFLYRIQPTRLEMLSEGATAREAEIVSQHFAYLQQAVAEGKLLVAGRTLNTDASAFGIAIFRAESDAAAQQFMLADPAVRHGVMRAELFPYRVALLAEKWEELTG